MNNIVMTTSATVNRVAGRIDVAGNVDTSTFFTMANSGNNVRSAATTNGTEFWIAGAGGGTAGGVWYNTLGGAGTETRIVSTPNNVRWLAIFGNQLYGSSNTDPFSSRLLDRLRHADDGGTNRDRGRRPAEQRRRTPTGTRCSI